MRMSVWANIRPGEYSPNFTAVIFVYILLPDLNLFFLSSDVRDPWYPYRGHSYQFFSDSGKSRDAAAATCSQYNAYLVAIESEREMDFIARVLNKQGYDNNHFYWWTGGKRAEPFARDWVWEKSGGEGKLLF